MDPLNLTMAKPRRLSLKQPKRKGRRRPFYPIASSLLACCQFHFHRSTSITCYAFSINSARPSAPKSGPTGFARTTTISPARSFTQKNARAFSLAAELGDMDRRAYFQIADSAAHLDPLLTSFLLRSIRSNGLDDCDNSSDEDRDSEFFDDDELILRRDALTVSDVSKAMIGLQTWDESLRKGRLPLVNDFKASSPDGNPEIWPEEPLFSCAQDVLVDLGLARLVRRHPEILPSVLLSVAKMVVQFTIESRQGKLTIVNTVNDDGKSNDDNIVSWENYESIDDDEYSQDFSFQPLSSEEIETLAKTVASDVFQEWGGVVRGVSLLDKVFGYNHGLLDLQGDVGFGIEDGVWQHNGWQPMPALQKQLASMPELRDLLSLLGRRPTARGKEMRKFRPRKRSASMEDMKGVEIDPIDPTSVSGLTLSGNLATMLPNEAVLLRSSMKSLRWLFLAKKAEEKLLSYELSGWTDVPTKNMRKPRRSVHLPAASGGPLIICLDTSWSMTGLREILAKSVVLASVIAANSQGRECRVVSFSSSNNAVESGVISCNAEGVRKLLDFLSYSFGGGTDVTGALKYVLDSSSSENDVSSSDIILVTDGELPNPPVSNAIMAKLDTLKRQTGVEVHGLLVGRKESAALDSLCDQVHDFLVHYESLQNVSIGKKHHSTMAYSFHGKSKLTSPLTSVRGWSSRPNFRALAHRRRFTFGLTSVLSDEDMNHIKIETQSYKKDRRSGTKRNRFDDDDEGSVYDLDEGGGSPLSFTADGSSKTKSNTETDKTEKSEYVLRVEDSINDIRGTAKESINSDIGAVEELQNEIDLVNSLWSKSYILSDSIAFIESGLIEREVEARLVVLAMVSQEHVLFVGPPGTSKSVLSAKLAQLCGGPFFQRLFTRFTTPEELFGPLSLRALENDEYVRCIDGFLPTASVAFIDEIFKANSAILNTLLTILNERTFDNGAGKRVACPLKCVVGASNELPDTEELDALLDRFLLRAQVNPVSDAGLIQLLSQSSNSNIFDDSFVNNMASDLEALVTDVSCSLGTITMDESICILIRDLRTFVRDELGVYISDRRLVKASRLLRVSAATHGRSRVDYVDCLLLQHILWQVPEQRLAIREWLLDHINPGESIVEQSKFLMRGIASEAASLVKTTMGDVTGEFGAREKDIESIKSIRSGIKEIEKMLQRHRYDLVRHIQLLEQLPEHLWLGLDESHAAKQHLLPLSKSALEVVNEALIDATSFEIALSPKVENDLRSSILDILLENDNDAMVFTYEELNLSLKEAKKKFDSVTLRKWKAAKKDFVV
mmetsp:Transcript_23552/g.49358  ORF Transcript_23552/g.49358 Transcript_23552/m.49358 type:complete len:1294 (+) Transcript_23552:86-3967(+)